MLRVSNLNYLKEVLFIGIHDYFLNLINLIMLLLKEVITNILLSVTLVLYSYTYSSLVGTFYFVFALVLISVTFDPSFTSEANERNSLIINCKYYESLTLDHYLRRINYLKFIIAISNHQKPTNAIQ